MRTRILLADDHLVVRQGMRVLLEKEGFEIVAEAGDGQAALRSAQERCPDVAILDFAMPRLNGLDAARAILRACPGTKAILLTVEVDLPYVVAALQAGVTGFVVKTQEVGDLVQAIHDVVNGKVYLSSGISETEVSTRLKTSEVSEDPLSPRDYEILHLIAEGKSTKDVAKLLGISVKTAEYHRTRIMKKIDVHDTAGLVRYALRHGLIEP